MEESQQMNALAPTRIRQKPTNGSSRAHWTPDEDSRLRQLLNNIDRANWTELVPHFPGKTAQQISERWGKVVNPTLVKGSWTRQEDETIIEFVAQFGVKNWTKLADLLPGRIGKQCRERWRNHLDPGNSKEPWTEEEDQTLIKLHEQYGNQWVKIATMMPGRSDNNIKNRWNSTLRKRGIANVSVSYTTPQKKGKKRKIDTPSSAELVVPKPNLDEMSKQEPVMIPTFGWTPQMDAMSPLMTDKSPCLMSPFMRNAMMSPLGDFLRTPGRESFLCSPTLGRTFSGERPGSLLSALDLDENH